MGSVGFNLIVRDAEDTLSVCLKSVEGLWDRLLVVDTGSVDRTREVALGFGAEVIEFPWCDNFSAARNFGWEKLDTDLKFWLDADDLLCGREYFDEMVLKCEEKGLDAVILEYLYAFDSVGARLLEKLEPLVLERRISSDEVFAQLKPRCVTTQYRERLVKNIPGWIFFYEVHEALPANGKRLGKYDKVKIIHRRHVRKNPVSGDRNLNILLNIPESKRDERHWFYLGLEHAHHGELDQAIAGFERYLPLSTVGDEHYLAFHFLADLYRHKGNLDRSEFYDLQAVALRPTWRDAYAGLLETLVRKQDWMKALYYGAMTKKAEIPETPFAYNPLHEEVGWVGDYVRALVELGQYEEALAESERALQVVPEDAAIQHNVDVLSVQLNVQRGTQRVADAVEFFLRHDDSETAALILARLGPEVRSHPDLRRWVRVAGSICGPASRGQIPKDELRIHPAAVRDWEINGAISYQLIGSQVNELQGVWADPRAQHFRDLLARRPEIRRVLQVGGPVEMREFYRDLGLEAARVEAVNQIGGGYDAVVLWGCLERVKDPDRVATLARTAVRPGGWLFACVPDGPSSKGLGPPQVGSARLRAYSVDTFRRVVGTVRMPDRIPGWSAQAGDLWLSVPVPASSGRPKRIGIVCPVSPEPWGPDSLGTGIGGSEEAVIRLSRAFARRGHAVTVYGSGYSGTDLYNWPYLPGTVLPLYEPLARYQPQDVVIGWRYPEIFLNQIRPFEAEFKFLWLHDSVAKERVAAAAPMIDCVYTISVYHAGLYDGISGVHAGRNGIDPDMFDVDQPARNPAKMIWSSTPFRGLDVLLGKHWPGIKRRVPEAELHCFYGWESADKMGVTSTPNGAEFKRRVMELVKQPGVVWRGRVGQPELYREYMSAGVFPYSATWSEENCITSYIAQAAGVWPVVYPLGALPQSVVFGWKVGEGEFVDAVVDAVRTEENREQMMEWARRWLTWGDVAAEFERLWLGRVG